MKKIAQRIRFLMPVVTRRLHSLTASQTAGRGFEGDLTPIDRGVAYCDLDH